MGIKPKAVQQEAELDAVVKSSTPMEMKPGKPLAPPSLPEENVAPGYEMVMRQLQNIWEKVVAIELIVTAHFPSGRMVDDTHPAPVVAPYPRTTNGGHPIVKAPNGMVKPAAFIEVPTVEQLLAATKEYKTRHPEDGQAKLTELVKSFGVAKISQMNEEQRAAFMEKIRE